MSGGTVHKAAAARTASRQRATERKRLRQDSSSDEALMGRALVWKNLGVETPLNVLIHDDNSYYSNDYFDVETYVNLR
ncbi:hypothetical protein Scep_012947 [Stephania cephalantha]|uniref:Uncharacterized protein n=1 Tax=Stephania cephalantha TaxID=152367 RepID=A0AAP0P825_9MAGN